VATNTRGCPAKVASERVDQRRSATMLPAYAMGSVLPGNMPALRPRLAPSCQGPQAVYKGCTRDAHRMRTRQTGAPPVCPRCASLVHPLYTALGAEQRPPGGEPASYGAGTGSGAQVERQSSSFLGGAETAKPLINAECSYEPKHPR
jgi:hypothetical protein